MREQNINSYLQQLHDLLNKTIKYHKGIKGKPQEEE